MRGLVPPDLAVLSEFNVNLEGQPETLWFPLYDYQTYPSAGFSGETLFFQVPIGQDGKTLEDTNMRSQGRLPTPINMMVTGIECMFRPAPNPAALSGGINVTESIWNDLYAVHSSRMSVQLRIGDKDSYVQEAPLGIFPPQWRLAGTSAVHYTQAAAADELAKFDYASFCGAMYQVTPMRLISNQEFALMVRSPSLIPLPSGQDARWGFRLHGYRYRLAQ